MAFLTIVKHFYNSKITVNIVNLASSADYHSVKPSLSVQKGDANVLWFCIMIINGVKIFRLDEISCELPTCKKTMLFILKKQCAIFLTIN